MPYTVKQVSALTGIAPDRLRAWERRYGVVTPARSESRYRLYDDQDLARLRMMVRLVDSGAPASLAAQQVREAFPEPVAGADALSAEGQPLNGASGVGASGVGSSGVGPSRVGASAGGSSVIGASGIGASAESPPDTGLSPGSAPNSLDGSAAPGLDALVAPARSLERDEVEQVLDRAFAAGSFESVVERWLLPALHALGDAWVDGRVDVAGEHLVSGAVRSRLGRAFEAAGSALDGPVVLVGLPPGALHELGSLSFAICLRRLGADVRWLGGDLPVESWAHAADRLRPAAVVLSVPTTADSAAAHQVVSRLTGAHPAMRVFVGGGGSPSVLAQAAVGRDASAVPLPDSVVTAAREVAVQLRRV